MSIYGDTLKPVLSTHHEVMNSHSNWCMLLTDVSLMFDCYHELDQLFKAHTSVACILERHKISDIGSISSG